MKRRDFIGNLTSIVGVALFSNSCLQESAIVQVGYTLPVTNMYILSQDVNFNTVTIHAEANNRYVDFDIYSGGFNLTLKPGNVSHAGGGLVYRDPYGNVDNVPRVAVSAKDIDIGRRSLQDSCFFEDFSTNPPTKYGRLTTNDNIWVGVVALAGTGTPQNIIFDTLSALSGADGNIYNLGNFESGRIVTQNGFKYYQQPDNVIVPCI